MACLDRLLERHSFDYLTLKNVCIFSEYYDILETVPVQIKIDSDFLTYLEDTVRELDKLGLIGVEIEENCRARLDTMDNKLWIILLFFLDFISSFQI